MTSFKLYLCADCGSPDVELTAWITANGDTVVGTGDEGPTDQQWCPVCERHDVGTVELPWSAVAELVAAARSTVVGLEDGTDAGLRRLLAACRPFDALDLANHNPPEVSEDTEP